MRCQVATSPFFTIASLTAPLHAGSRCQVMRSTLSVACSLGFASFMPSLRRFPKTPRLFCQIRPVDRLSSSAFFRPILASLGQAKRRTNRHPRAQQIHTSLAYPFFHHIFSQTVPHRRNKPLHQQLGGLTCGRREDLVIESVPRVSRA
ncbi:unnamed protein product [Protopolystoma xenopodis]|uniref:Uncharacterized protein n=1 Tax=Protopolystoma xenopodis TaxID=117903 RepID=A0A3S5BCJ5_9PLAT|nr:unnamed protein product [Protopolystoma xenopodis]